MKALRACGSAVSLLMLAVWMTGCVCCSNRRAEIPTITCQPEDKQVTEGGTAVFEVGVSERAIRYEWARLKLTANGLVEESLKDKPGGKTSRLTMEKVTQADQTYYFCTVVHEVFGELGEVYSRTRNAHLNVVTPQHRILFMSTTGTVVVAQVATRMLATATGGGDTTCDPGGSYTTSLSYANDDMIRPFLPDPSIVSGELKVNQVDANGNETPLDNTKFAAQWSTAGAGNTGCANDEVGAKSRFFNVIVFNKKHTFTIYFLEPQTAGTTYKLYVNWY